MKLSEIFFFIFCFFFAGNVCVFADNDAKKQIGQMLILGFKESQVNKDTPIAKTIHDLNLGGVILFDSYLQNIISPEQVKKLCADLQKESDETLLIAVDVEGGLINRLNPKYGFIDTLSHQKLGQIDDVEKTYSEAFNIALQLKRLGINTNFAPVVDLNRNTLNPIIAKKERSFSSDPKKVVEHAGVFIKAHRDNNIITAIKHFPGHGSSKGDTHVGLVDLTNTYDDIELEPFEKLILEGSVDMVMTSHVINKKFDKDYPVTLSNYYIENILRKQYKFDGVVVSDDMYMGAIVKHYALKEAIIRAINAGCDMLILSNNAKEYDENAAYKAVKIISEAMDNGLILEDRINKSLERIKLLKKRLN